MLNEGADPGGRSDTGFCALWQADHAKTRPASIALRKWGCASLIILDKPHILYKMRDSPWVLGCTALIQNRTRQPALGQRRKGTLAVTLGTNRYGPGRALTCHYLTARPARIRLLDCKTFDSGGGLRSGLRPPRPLSPHGPQRIAPAHPSNPPIIRTPVLDRLLDIRPRQFLFQRALHQFRNLPVRGEAQGNQLGFAQFGNPSPQGLR